MKLGYASPRQMLDEMSSRDLGMWLAFLHIGSPDDDVMDERFAMMSTAAMNGPHFVKADKRSYEPLDFLPKKREAARRREQQTVQDIRNFFMNRGK